MRLHRKDEGSTEKLRLRLDGADHLIQKRVRGVVGSLSRLRKAASVVGETFQCRLNPSHAKSSRNRSSWNNLRNQTKPLVPKVPLLAVDHPSLTYRRTRHQPPQGSKGMRSVPPPRRRRPARPFGSSSCRCLSWDLETADDRSRSTVRRRRGVNVAEREVGSASGVCKSPTVDTWLRAVPPLGLLAVRRSSPAR